MKMTDTQANAEVGMTDELAAFPPHARPEFKRMMEDAEAGQFDVLIVARIDRFGREATHAPEAVKTLTDLGITFMPV